MNRDCKTVEKLGRVARHQFRSNWLLDVSAGCQIQVWAPIVDRVQSAIVPPTSANTRSGIWNRVSMTSAIIDALCIRSRHSATPKGFSASPRAAARCTPPPRPQLDTFPPHYYALHCEMLCGCLAGDPWAAARGHHRGGAGGQLRGEVGRYMRHCRSSPAHSTLRLHPARLSRPLPRRRLCIGVLHSSGIWVPTAEQAAAVSEAAAHRHHPELPLHRCIAGTFAPLRASGLSRDPLRALAASV